MDDLFPRGTLWRFLPVKRQRQKTRNTFTPIIHVFASLLSVLTPDTVLIPVLKNSQFFGIVKYVNAAEQDGSIITVSRTKACQGDPLFSRRKWQSHSLRKKGAHYRSKRKKIKKAHRLFALWIESYNSGKRRTNFTPYERRKRKVIIPYRSRPHLYNTPQWEALREQEDPCKVMVSNWSPATAKRGGGNFVWRSTAAPRQKILQVQ